MIQNPAAINNEILDLRAQLFGSELFFTQTFYKLRTGRDFRISLPTGRESHFLTICRMLTKVFRGEIKKLRIHIPPRYGKTELLIHFVAWSLARYPDCNFIYTSYSKTLAERQTETVRSILTLPYYRKIFDVRIAEDSSAKDNFHTNKGGQIYAAGAGGTITGMGAGITGVKDRFSGALLIDDIHKPDEVASDTIRRRDVDWFFNTAQSRLNNGDDTPIIFIGQKLHEDDLPANLHEKDGWTVLSIPALDAANNALYPELHTKEDLLRMKELQPYVFAAQMQQDPIPAGGGLFKKDDFTLMEQTPKIIATIITADTAETDKDYNDRTVFSFFGLYKIIVAGIESDLYGLHWLDCEELSIEPKDLENEFLAFYARCMRFSVKPEIAAIEKKSTGVTLVSVLKKMQGLQILEIERTRASGSKTTRFLEMQPIIAQKLISLPKEAKHTNMCIEHCAKITANNSHRWDDIADTLYDAVKLALIDKVLIMRNIKSNKTANVVKNLANNFNKLQRLRRTITWQP
jgi:predicted phage terminase large subunit-like protein